MHWISLIGVLMIVSICRVQSSSSFKNFDTSNGNKGGIYQVSSGNGADASGSQNGADGSVHITSGNVPSGGFPKHFKDEQNTFKYVSNSGNFNQCYIVLPIFIAAFTAMIRF